MSNSISQQEYRRMCIANMRFLNKYNLVKLENYEDYKKTPLYKHFYDSGFSAFSGKIGCALNPYYSDSETNPYTALLPWNDGYQAHSSKFNLINQQLF